MQHNQQNLIEKYRGLITSNGVDSNFFKILESAEIYQVNGYLGEMLYHASEGDQLSILCVQAISNAFKFYPCSEYNNQWLADTINGLSTNNDHQGALSELEAYGNLSHAFSGHKVQHIDENSGRDGRTPDLKVGQDLFVEVYCPKESEISKNTKKKIKEALKPVKPGSASLTTAFCHPITGGDTEESLKYRANKVIARFVNAKRHHDQTTLSNKNILWVDARTEWQCYTKHTTPMLTYKVGNSTVIESFGIWHSLYGQVGKSRLFTNRFCLHTGSKLANDSYFQRDNNGLFRERASLSAVVVTCLDGKVIFLNPWADQPLTTEQVNRLTKLEGFKPEYSFFIKETLKSDIKSKLIMMDFLLGVTAT